MRGAPRREPGPPPAHPALQRRSGNTITVRPRRGVTANGPEGGSPAAPPVPPAPSAAPPGPPKKRYPTAEEIQVIGGYLALPRSCLAKNDPHRKKLKIWFSERELERTFCYPSEGAVLAAWGPPEEPPPPGPPSAPDEEEEEDEPPTTRGLPGGLRARALLVGECRG
ncbi:PPR18 protein, partial [Cepphus grylle]|nr:PPR18 protein [Cepphus grylle]